ncbi:MULTISPECIES: PRD domain-containing protein [unclassified Breznakia]|uniref:PRD domain-containing protein n=1 Tax=unclassified Breznakia TaxID=2623764 RepID=UPI0024060569|nr:MULTISPECIES: PRD domain-containing protein [unclassified Breznakia]
MSKVIIEDMNANFNLSLNDNAMADIAIIIAAARHHVSPLHILKIMEQINEMIKLIKYHFMFKLDHKSISGRRLIEHLKYLSIRILKKQKDVSNIDEWFPEARKKYQLPYKCAENIAQFLKQKYEFDLTGTEIIFLTIHIQSLIYETE